MDFLNKAAAQAAAAAQHIQSQATAEGATTPRSLIRNLAAKAGASDVMPETTLDPAKPEIMTPTDAESEVERWKARATSLEARMKAATDARRTWQLQEAEMKQVCGRPASSQLHPCDALDLLLGRRSLC